jgi:hypothetical protein
VNRFYSYADVGDPDVYLNEHDPDKPFAVVRFGPALDFTSKDPRWCRHVAQAWAQAADLLEPRYGRTAARQAGAELEAGQ